MIDFASEIALDQRSWLRFISFIVAWNLIFVWPILASWGWLAAEWRVPALLFSFSALYGAALLSAIPWAIRWLKPGWFRH